MTSTQVESGPFFLSISLKSAELPGSPLSKGTNCRRENEEEFAEASMITREFRETLPRLAFGDRSNKGVASRYSGQVDKSTVYQCEGRTNDLIDIQ